MSNNIRTRNGAPFDFEDGLKARGKHVPFCVQTLDELKALPVSQLTGNEVVEVLGLELTGDTYRMGYYWDASNAEAGSGEEVVVPNSNPSTGRWVKLQDQLRQDLADAEKGAGLVWFKQAGTGAVARTMLDKAREVVSVKDFGAVGDGVTDDTAAVQAAINAASGKALSVSSGGVYRVGQLELTAPVAIHGDGATELTCFGNKLFNIAPGVSISGLEIEGLICRNAGVAGGGSDQATAIYCDTTGSLLNSRIENNEVIGFGMGFSLYGSSASKTYTSADASTYTARGPDGRNIVSGNVIRDTLAATRIGTGGGHGIFVRSGYFQVTGNRIENMQGGILGPQHGIVSNNVVINAWEDNGIYLPGGELVSVVGNYIEKCKTDGIALSSSSYCTVVGNTIVRAGRAGIRIQQGHDLTIAGNVVFSPASQYMIGYVDAGSPNSPYNITISGNNFSGGHLNTVSPLTFQGPAAGGTPLKNWKFTGNQISDVDTSGATAAFYGPYKIVRFTDLTGAQNIVVEGNSFSNVTEIALSADGKYRYIDATRESNNTFAHKAGFTTLETLDTGVLSGSVRFACGGSGDVSSPSYRGFVNSVTKGASNGEYTITFSRKFSVRDFSWSASGTNAPFTVRMNVVNPATGDDHVSSVTVTLFTAAGAATWPNFNASILLSFSTNDASVRG